MNDDIYDKIYLATVVCLWFVAMLLCSVILSLTWA